LPAVRLADLGYRADMPCAPRNRRIRGPTARAQGTRMATASSNSGRKG
jgi:hypothetical protein